MRNDTNYAYYSMFPYGVWHLLCLHLLISYLQNQQLLVSVLNSLFLILLLVTQNKNNHWRIQSSNYSDAALEKQHQSTPTASQRHSRGAITAEIHTLRPICIIMLQHDTHIMFYIKNVTCTFIMHYKCTSINLIKCPPSSGVSLSYRVRGLTIIASLSAT